MNAPTELNSEEMLRIRLGVLRQEHRDLDYAIHVLETSGRGDQLAIRRLKKQKLSLKDQIARVENQLPPTSSPERAIWPKIRPSGPKPLVKLAAPPLPEPRACL